MTLLGVFGILLGAMAWLVAFIKPTKLRVSVFALAYVLHVGTSLVYYWGVQNSPADTALYYYDIFALYGDGVRAGTIFVVYLVQSIKAVIGGTYLDYFMLFQAVGFFGIALLMRISEEIFAELGAYQPLYTYWLLFLPGMHFWSSAIGKDSLFFFATVLALWAAMRIRERYKMLGAATALMLLIRPHIAILAAAAVALTVIMDRSIAWYSRLLLGVLAVIGAGLSVASVQTAYGIDLTNADSISDTLASQENMLDTEDAGNTKVVGAFYVRLLSLLFRPLFLDTEGFMGYAASAENVIFILVVASICFHFRAVRLLTKRIPFVRFAVVFSLLVIGLLAASYYNIGLGLRQKATMILPGVLVVFLALTAFLEARREAARVAAGRLSQ